MPVVDVEPSQFPLGDAGQRPVLFRIPSWKKRHEVRMTFPGAVEVGKHVACTWDLAPFIAYHLGLDPRDFAPSLESSWSDLQVEAAIRDMPGYERWKELELGEKLRPYQVRGALHLARRGPAFLCDAPRLGKTVEAVAAAVLAGARKVLVVAPATTKLGWAKEAYKWGGGVVPLIATGQKGTLVRWRCPDCNMSGLDHSSGQAEPDSNCPSCAMRNGYATGLGRFEALEIEGRQDVQVVDGSLVSVAIPHCKVHGDLTGRIGLTCPYCEEELHRKIDQAGWFIVNWDILAPRTEKDNNGMVHARQDQPGWVAALSRHQWDVVIADEIHCLRGWKQKADRKGLTRADCFERIVENIPQRWGLTATVICGFTRDCYKPWRLLTGGAATDHDNEPWVWMREYADAHGGGEQGGHYTNDGETERALTEMKYRLDCYRLERTMRDVSDQLPPKTREPVEIEPTDSLVADAEKLHLLLRSPKKAGKVEGAVNRALKRVLPLKLDVCVPSVLEDLASRNKVLVFTSSVDSCERALKAIQKGMKRADQRTLMRRARAKVWYGRGNDPLKRAAQAEQFVNYDGAGVFLTTIKSLQVGISMKGVTTTHFLELGWDADELIQAENRAYEIGTTGLVIRYYMVRKSIDDRQAARVLPKLATIEALTVDKDASGISSTLDRDTRKHEDMSFQELLSDLTAGVMVDYAFDLSELG